MSDVVTHIAADQPQGGSLYPFDRVDLNTSALIADFYLSYEDHACLYVKPFSISWLHGFGGVADSDSLDAPEAVHDFDIQVRDAVGKLVFDSTRVPNDDNHYYKQNWGQHLQIIEWHDTDSICRVVCRTSSAAGGTAGVFDVFSWFMGGFALPVSIVSEIVDGVDEDVSVNYYPEFAQLNERTLENLAKRVRSIRLVGFGAPAPFTGNNLLLRNGYNTELEVETLETTDGGRNQTQITLHAQPGTGLGRFTGCEEEQVVRSINLQPGSATGQFTIAAGDCYRVEIPHTIFDGEAEPTPHALRLLNDCGPCCECDDYLAVYEAIRRLRNRYLAIGQQAEAVRDLYRQNIQRWIGQGRGRAATPVRLAIYPITTNRVAISAAFCNTDRPPVSELELQFNFVYSDAEFPDVTANTPGAAVVVCGSSFRAGDFDRGDSLQTAGRPLPSVTKEPFALDGTYPTLSAFFASIPSGGMAFASFMLDFVGVEVGDTVEVVLVVNADGEIATYDSKWPDGKPEDERPVHPIKVLIPLLPDPCVGSSSASPE